MTKFELLNENEHETWERLRKMTVDELVTELKMAGGAACSISGRTTPEGWPFALVLAIASSPQRMAAVCMVKELDKFMELGVAAAAAKRGSDA